MLEVTPEDICALNDVDLRELVARLCEAEVLRAGHSAVAVTWGGSQTAKDGGVDVHVALPDDAVWAQGFVPRRVTGFQVKKPDMAAKSINEEMRPKGVLRPVIADLAAASGAYVIVSSTGTTSNTGLTDRKNAMRAAVQDLAGHERLHLDFYDRRRLATWVNSFPGVVLWAREKAGRAVTGWRPWGAWTGTASPSDGFISDRALRGRRNGESVSTAAALDWACESLAQPGATVRLVGLSGVGKTRFAQALFEPTATSKALDPALVMYTNMNDGPSPPPVAVATNLVATSARSVLVVDNCTPALHRQLAELCAKPGATVSLLTIEYDVREDQPERTEVLELEPGSEELIDTLLRRRFSALSHIDARRIMMAAGGNARIALVLADVAMRFGEIKSLTDDELFQRLFWQRHAVEKDLLKAAQFLSLVYSFNADPDSGASELEALGLLADQTPRQLLSACSSLAARDLLQARGPWRAILPHAIANRLAGWALDELPAAWICGPQGLGGSPRLLLSLSRRLSMIATHPKAMKIAAQWLAPGGLLGDLAVLSDDQRQMFRHVAAIDQMAAVTALERANSPEVWRNHIQTVRALAYEPTAFERCAQMLYAVAVADGVHASKNAAREQWTTLFRIKASGTHATLEQRLTLVEGLLNSADDASQSMGYAALNQLLATGNFYSGSVYEFGARSRDFGYSPTTAEAIRAWFAAVLQLCERQRLAHPDAIRSALGHHLNGLWTQAGMHEEVDHLARRVAQDGFWLDGWAACRRMLRVARTTGQGEVHDRLVRLEADLRPMGLEQRIVAVLRATHWDLDLELGNAAAATLDSYEQRAAAAKAMGAALAEDDALFDRLNATLHRGGVGAYALGEGLATGAMNPASLWGRLLDTFKSLPTSDRDVRTLKGYLSELARVDLPLAGALLDLAWQDASLSDCLVELQLAINLDAEGLRRLLKALSDNIIEVNDLKAIGYDSVRVQAPALRDFLVEIASSQSGTHVALSILSTRVWGEPKNEVLHPALHDAARLLLSRLTMDRSQVTQNSDYELADLVRRLLPGPEGAGAAKAFAAQFVTDLLEDRVYVFEHTDLLAALLEVQPTAVLDAWFEAAGPDQEEAARLLRSDSHIEAQPSGAIPADVLLHWCGKDASQRFPLAALFVPICRPQDASEHDIQWSDHALQLLIHAPNKDAVLERLADQFTPSTWSGSRAAIIERNASLLEQVAAVVDAAQTPGLPALKRRMAEEIAGEQASELGRHRHRDERFE